MDLVRAITPNGERIYWATEVVQDDFGNYTLTDKDGETVEINGLPVIIQRNQPYGEQGKLL